MVFCHLSGFTRCQVRLRMHPGIAKVPPNNDANRASVSPELTNAVLPRIVGPHTMPDRLSSELKSAASTLGCGLVCGLLLGAGTLHAAAAVGALSWRQLPTLPDTEGFAGMFAELQQLRVRG